MDGGMTGLATRAFCQIFSLLLGAEKITGNPRVDSREHDMERNAQSLRTVNMSHTGRVGYDRIRHKWPSSIIHSITPRILLDLMKMRPVTRLKARSPTPIDDLFHLPSTLLDSSAADCLETR